MRAKCFSQEDRLLMAERVRKNETGIQNREFKVCGHTFSIGPPTHDINSGTKLARPLPIQPC